MQKTIIPGVFSWSVWQPDRGVFFNSHFIEFDGGNLIVDPLELEDADADEISRRGGAAWVIVTNRDHERSSAATAGRFGAKIAAGEKDAALLARSPDRLLYDGDTIADAAVVALDGMKSPGEIALCFEREASVLVGDALWGEPAGGLSFPPRIDDPAKAIASLRKLAASRPQHLLVGDGASVFGRAYEAMHAFFASRSELYSNRINLDELTLLDPGDSDPPRYRARVAEIGCLIGAKKLGYQLADIPPGESFCPTHWHCVEEELFFVWEGTPTLLTPRGAFELRPGDFVAFPIGPAGAHKLTNESAKPCRVILLAAESEHDVCFYPDSGKIGVFPQRLLVRTEPALDYYDGEG